MDRARVHGILTVVMALASHLRRAPFALVATFALAVGGVACSGGGSKSAGTTPTTRAGTAVTIAAGPVTIASSGAAATLSDADRAAVVDTVRRYVTAASIDPLQGRPVGDLAVVFTALATARVNGPDHAAVLDAGLPKATGKVTATAKPLAMTALGDPTGAIVLVGVNLDLRVQATAAKGSIDVKRRGALVLAKDGDTWKIASYHVTVTRTGAGLAPNAASTSTTASTP